MRTRLSLLSLAFLMALGAALALPSSSPIAAEKIGKAVKVNNTPTLTLAVDEGLPLTLPAPASSVFIANPEIADIQVMSPTSVMIFGKRTGLTTFMASDGAGHTLIHRTVTVAQNLDALRVALNAVIPNNKINVEAVPNGIILTGEAKDPGSIEDAKRLALRYMPKEGEVINRIKVIGSNQIHIRVRFAEVSRDVNKQFGIDWESLGTIGGIAIGLASGSALFPTKPGSDVPYYPLGDVGSTLLNRVRPSSNGTPNNIVSFSKGGLNGMVDALAEDGFVTILAEPNLTAMSGETASFLAGGEFPIPVPQSNSSISVEYKQYGVSLAFTPTLVGEDRISMHVRPEVSQITDVGAVTLNSVSIPALTTRRAETTIEIASGQSFAIGGLLNNNQNQSVSKYPFLGDLPVLGALFRSTSFQNNQSELVIIITPYIVKPSTEKQLALPTDGFSPPSDIEQIFDFRKTSGDPNTRPVSGPPIAALVEQPAPIPSAAPVAPVAKEAPVEANKTPLQTPIPSATPSGPSGFILE